MNADSEPDSILTDDSQGSEQDSSLTGTSSSVSIEQSRNAFTSARDAQFSNVCNYFFLI
jgi:hypothetical protein